MRTGGFFVLFSFLLYYPLSYFSILPVCFRMPSGCLFILFNIFVSFAYQKKKKNSFVEFVD